MLLAIDTATRAISLALHDGRILVAEQTWQAGRRHTIMLASSIQTMFEESALAFAALKAVAVSIGPGSYTGLRIGISLAKGIASARHLPLVGVSALDTLAAGQPFSATRYTLIGVVEAGRNRIVAQRFLSKKGRWTPIDEPQNTEWLQLFNTIEDNTYVTGEVSRSGQELLKMAQQQGVPVTLVSAAYRARRAGFLAEEALRRLRENREEDYAPAKLRPIYIQSSK